MYQAVIVLLGKGCMEPVQDEENIAKVKQQTIQLNSFLSKQTLMHTGMNTVASPVTGGGHPLPPVGQFFVEASQQGRAEPQQWAEYAWQQLSAIGKQLIKDGKPLESEEDNLAELRIGAENFAKIYFPILKALGIV